MRRSLTIGQVLGIPLKIHLNWFLIAALVTWSLAVGYFPHEHPGRQASVYWMAGLFTALLFFGSVLSHELGHALVAQREGVPVNSITLFIFGGIAHIAHEPETAGSEFRIVFAGPLASLGLAGVFHFFGYLVSFSPEMNSAALYLSRMNIILALFNLLPGFPLDGGRILRSLFWKWKNNFILATRWATNTGLGIAVLFILGGVALMIFGNYFDGLWIVFIGWYLSAVSRLSSRQAFADDAESDGQEEDPELALTGHRNTIPLLRPVLTPPRSTRHETPAGVFGSAFVFPRLPDRLEEMPSIFFDRVRVRKDTHARSLPPFSSLNPEDKSTTEENHR